MLKYTTPTPPPQKKKSGQQPKKPEVIEKCGKYKNIIRDAEIPMYQSLFIKVKRQEKKHPTLEEGPRQGRVLLQDIGTGNTSRQ